MMNLLMMKNIQLDHNHGRRQYIIDVRLYIGYGEYQYSSMNVQMDQLLLKKFVDYRPHHNPSAD